jgi:uncharacterized protein
VSGDAETGVTLDVLLELQELDLGLDRLRHRRDTLPERDKLAAVASDLAQTERELAAVRPERDEAAREEKRLDDEATSLESKAAEVERKLYSGEISSPRELQAMQADVESLRRHRRNLEDRELEVMERREAFDATMTDLEARAGALRGEATALAAALADAEAVIDKELEAERSARETLATRFSSEILGEYERRRARNRGVGAARLVGTSCQGCHLSIPSVEAERIRRAAPGTLAFCDNCGCILIP